MQLEILSRRVFFNGAFVGMVAWELPLHREHVTFRKAFFKVDMIHMQLEILYNQV